MQIGGAHQALSSPPRLPAPGRAPQTAGPQPPAPRGPGNYTDSTFNKAVAVDATTSALVLTGTFFSANCTFGQHNALLGLPPAVLANTAPAGPDPIASGSDIFLAKVRCGREHKAALPRCVESIHSRSWGGPQVLSNGTVAWMGGFGVSGGIEQGSAVAVDFNSNVLMAAVMNTNRSVFGKFTLSSRGGVDSVLVKTNSSGAVLWAQQLGGSGDDFVYGTAVDQQGYSLIAGQALSAAVTFGGGATVGGSLTLVSQQDIFLAKISPNGAPSWAKAYGGVNADDQANNVAVDPITGSAIVTGHFSSSPATFGGKAFVLSPVPPGSSNASSWDGFVMRVNSIGSTEWVIPIAGNDMDDVLGNFPLCAPCLL